MKNLFYILILVFFLASCNTQSKLNSTAKSDNSPKEVSKETTPSNDESKTGSTVTNNSSDKNSINQQIVNSALDNLGVPYKSGGTTKAGMDCSGMVYSTFKKKNINLPRTSYEMSKYGNQIDKSLAKPGDLIFFKTNGKTVINHVGIITEVDRKEIKFVHSSSSKGVILSTTASAYYAQTYSQINRIKEVND